MSKKDFYQNTAQLTIIGKTKILKIQQYVLY
jgi:hypothetical protein